MIGLILNTTNWMERNEFHTNENLNTHELIELRTMRTQRMNINAKLIKRTEHDWTKQQNSHTQKLLTLKNRQDDATFLYNKKNENKKTILPVLLQWRVVLVLNFCVVVHILLKIGGFVLTHYLSRFLVSFHRTFLSFVFFVSSFFPPPYSSEKPLCAKNIFVTRNAISP